MGGALAVQFGGTASGSLDLGSHPLNIHDPLRSPARAPQRPSPIPPSDSNSVYHRGQPALIQPAPAGNGHTTSAGVEGILFRDRRRPSLFHGLWGTTDSRVASKTPPVKVMSGLPERGSFPASKKSNVAVPLFCQ